MPSNEIMSMEGQLVGMPLAGPESFSQQQLDYLKRALGVDETVLWDGNGTPASTCTLSEALTNFDRFRVAFDLGGQGITYHEAKLRVVNGTIDSNVVFIRGSGYGNAYLSFFLCTYNKTTLTFTIDRRKGLAVPFSTTSTTFTGSTDANPAMLVQVVGIKRVAGGN